MTGSVDLICSSSSICGIEWPVGEIYRAPFTPSGIHEVLERNLSTTTARAWLFWRSEFGGIDSAFVEGLLPRSGTVWHSGLKLGMGGKPGLLDFVAPTWMLNRDPSQDIETTSWRMALDAALIPTDVLRQMGGITLTFKTLEGAALEMGHRYISNGVILWHVPGLVNKPVDTKFNIPFEDELRFIQCRYGRRWAFWALARALMTRYVSPREGVPAILNVRDEGLSNPARAFHRQEPESIAPENRPEVTVIIPTLSRYDHLRPLLDQMRTQTIPASEIIVVDQTPEEIRDNSLADDFPDLPLRVVVQEVPGQCTARNFALEMARGEAILFLDDDVSIEPELIKAHLENLACFDCAASSGVYLEERSGPPPKGYRCYRVSDIFPTGNSMIWKAVLTTSGPFDIRFDRVFSDDADLGIRIYLSGALMIYDPDIAVVHHHASVGGLRSYGQRAVTYASSRRKILHQNLPTTAEIFYAERYFTKIQIREMLWLRVLGTMSLHQNGVARVLKFVAAVISLPNTLWRIRINHRQAMEWGEVKP